MTAQSNEFLAQRFEENRDRLTRVAFRMLGSRSEADDAVQEGWLRLSRANTSGVDNLGAWLTTVVARVCLDQLRARDSRREDSLGDRESEIAPLHAPSPDALHDAQVADSIGIAMLVVLETLEPSERVAFVLHDMFDLSFAEIAPIVGRNPAATRQLASRARRRVRGASAAPSADLARRRAIVEAFLAASRGGDFGALLAMLDPNAVLRADVAAVKIGAKSEMAGADAVATRFSGHAKEAQLALIDGEPGAVWAPGGKPRVVFAFEIADDRIIAIDLISGAELLAEMELEMLEG